MIPHFINLVYLWWGWKCQESVPWPKKLWIEFLTVPRRKHSEVPSVSCFSTKITRTLVKVIDIGDPSHVSYPILRVKDQRGTFLKRVKRSTTDSQPGDWSDVDPRLPGDPGTYPHTREGRRRRDRVKSLFRSRRIRGTFFKHVRSSRGWKCRG